MFTTHTHFISPDRLCQWHCGARLRKITDWRFNTADGKISAGLIHSGEGLVALHWHIGTSGWHYDHWQRRFYPPELAKAKWLEFYARHFTTVELNNSFYRLPSETDWAKRLAGIAAKLKAIYIYFNNDAEAFATRNAVTISGYLQK